MYTFHVTDVCLWCHCTCMFAFYCSSHLAGSVSLADSVKSMHQLISHPIDRGFEGNSSGLKTDIGPISVLCRFNMISMSGRYSNRHRTYIKTYCKIWAARYRLIISPHNTYEEALREHKLVTCSSDGMNCVTDFLKTFRTLVIGSTLFYHGSATLVIS